MKNQTFLSVRLLVILALFTAAAFGNTVTLDPTFNGTGYRIQTIAPPPGDAFAGSMARQPDGKIVVAGYVDDFFTGQDAPGAACPPNKCVSGNTCPQGACPADRMVR